MTSKSELKRLAFTSPIELADKYHDLEAEIEHYQKLVHDIEAVNGDKIEAHEKREAALLAFVEAFDARALAYDLEIFIPGLVEAREQLRGVIDGMD